MNNDIQPLWNNDDVQGGMSILDSATRMLPPINSKIVVRGESATVINSFMRDNKCYAVCRLNNGTVVTEQLEGGAVLLG